MGSEETSRQESTILERQLNGKEQEITKVKVEMSEEIQRLNSELDGMGIMLKGKEEQIRRAKRRSKLRVYLPWYPPKLMAAMRLKIVGPTDGQAATLAFSQSEMSTLWPPELPGMSRGVVFYLGVLQMPSESH
jgi:hypothetical protein